MLHQIRQGQHRDGYHVDFMLFPNRLSGYFKLHEDCIYTPRNAQINKITGFSEGPHQYQSARIGWRCTDRNLTTNFQLLTYCYFRGQRVHFHLSNIFAGHVYRYVVETKPQGYRFYIKDQTTGKELADRIAAGDRFKFPIGYRLWPYFGGEHPAYQDMTIDLEIEE